MNILYQCDDKYAPFTGISMYSLLENNRSLDSIKLFVIDDSISKKNRDIMMKCASSYDRELCFIDSTMLLNTPDARSIQSYKGTRKNTHSFLKVLAIDNLPDDVDRILYIDSDTLVLGPLDDLEKTDLQGRLIGMVMDSLVDKSKQLIGFDRRDPYYNSGVIYIDVKKWKSEQCGRRAVQHALTHSYGTVDQDLLNVEFKDEILTLPPNYNYQPHHLHYSTRDYFEVITHKGGIYYSPEEIENARNDIRIMHFFRYLGEQPWHEGNLHPCTPYYDRYLAASPWNDLSKMASPRNKMFYIERILYRILPDRLFLRLFMWFFLLKLKKDISDQNKG